MRHDGALKFAVEEEDVRRLWEVEREPYVTMRRGGDEDTGRQSQGSRIVTGRQSQGCRGRGVGRAERRQRHGDILSDNDMCIIKYGHVPRYLPT